MIRQPTAQQSLLTSKSDKNPEKYKKKLLAQVVTIFTICLIIILERVFYQIVIDMQENGLIRLQQYAGLVKQTGENQYTADGIKNSFLQFFDSLSEFSIQFLLLTHFLATIYVGFNALIATKVTFVSLGLVYAVSVLQLFYTGCRPFWSQKGIMASRCLSAFNHPSLGLILMLFAPIYTFYCWRQNMNRQKQLPKKYLISSIILMVLTLAIQFLNFLTGTVYLINIVMSIVVCVLFLMIMISSNRIIDKAIKQSTLFKSEAKKYVFYWLLLICLLATFVLFVYSGEDLFLDIDWVENYMDCTRYLGYADKTYRYDEVIGPWFNFVQTSVLFAWVGAVFGISYCFRKISNVNWAAGNLKQKLLRAFITNLLIIPSWIFISYIQYNGKWIQDIGLNHYLVNALHFFILYLWIFGYMPAIIFHKLLKITNKQDSDFYVIMEEDAGVIVDR